MAEVWERQGTGPLPLQHLELYPHAYLRETGCFARLLEDML
jgi:hypothetical protein